MSGIWQSLVGQTHWLWIILGILLCAGEIFAPGVFLIWIGLAAIATGVVVLVVPMSATWSLIVFALLSMVAVLIVWKLYGSQNPEADSDQPFLNRRTDALIGRTFVLSRPIAGGEGVIRINDANWRVRGPDMPAGTRVRVTGVQDATVLLVEQD